MRLRAWAETIRRIVAENKLASLLFLVAAFLRFFRLEEFVTFLGDQGRDAIIMKRIVTFEHFPAIGAPTSIGQIYLGPFYYYLMSPFLWLWRYDPVGPVVGVALLTLVGLAAGYLAIKKFAGKQTALLFLFLTTFSFANIELARFSWNPNLLPVTAFFALYFFYMTIQKPKQVFYPLLFGAFLSFSVQLHYLAVFLALPAALLLLKEFVDKHNVVRHLKNLAFSIGSFALFSVPLLIFDLRHEFLNSRNFLKLFAGGEVTSTAPYTQRLVDSLQGFMNAVIPLPFDRTQSVIVIIAIGIAYLIARRGAKVISFADLLMANVICYLVAFALLGSPRYPHYYGTIYWSFFAAVGAALASYMKSVRYALLCILLLFIYVYINAQHYYFFVNSPGHQIRTAQEFAQIIEREVTATPYQVVSLPYTETDAHIRYFLELNGRRPLPENTLEQPEELFVLCHESPCQVLGNPQWQIASFKNGKIVQSIKKGTVVIYKVVHEK